MMHINSLVSKLNLKDPWSAITHGIAMLLAIAGTVPLLLRAASGENAPLHIAALAVFILTMILLYTASTVYHSVDSTATVNRRLRKMDHMMIFVMIAGSYTPICLIALHNRIGYILCGLYGALRSWAFYLRVSGSPARNGSLLCFISVWDGCASLPLSRFFTLFRVPVSAGFSQEALFTPSAASSMV